MKAESLDADYWRRRWTERETGWDIGYPSTPLKAFIDQLDERELNILIPGCGNAYEGAYLFEKGFERTTLIDLAPEAVEAARQKSPHIPAERYVVGDFFEHEGAYDLILEQTFFCALHPEQRGDYARKMHSLLKPGGILAGVLFEDELFQDHPPYGGYRQNYRPHFEGLFDFLTFERCYNSIPPRANRELFIRLRKRES